MLKNLSAVAMVTGCASLALAGGYGDYAEVPYVRPATDLAYDIDQYEADNHRVFDLLVVVDDGDRWTAASYLAYTWCVADPDQHCATFWDHPVGGHTQPETTQFTDYGLLQYDTFITCPEEYPNPDLDPTENATTFAPGSPLQTGPYVYEVEWYADPELPNADGGTYALARFNLTIDCSLCECPVEPGECYDYEPFPGAPVCAYFTIEGCSYFACCESPWPYQIDIPVCWCIPEPSGTALLALGGLALIRRR
jgi:hypothetical protein